MQLVVKGFHKRHILELVFEGHNLLGLEALLQLADLVGASKTNSILREALEAGLCSSEAPVQL